MKIEGGPYTPPPSAQYAIRTVRVAQAAAVVAYLFGEQLFASLRRPTPSPVLKMQENPLIALGTLYGLDVVAQTMKSINAFEITYNGHVLHSKLQSGTFPRPAELVARLSQLKQQESRVGDGSDAAAAVEAK
mmetsp:Transcript_31061/g.65442  ORF Transcript_31061/g.65442 Transcript_31061/m.65442 type:complete len:132 (+) Transcript_31061:350-745(+)